MTRQNIPQLDQFKAIADRFGAQLRLTRLRPSGRGADVWHDLHPLPEQQRVLYDWLVAHGEEVLTGDSFFHLSAYGSALPGLNLCGAGRVVCLIDPVGDVYACPFAIHSEFLAGNVRDTGGFETVWKSSPLFASLRAPDTGGACRSCGFYDSCRGGCMAAKFFTGLPLDGPDPECVQGYGSAALAAVSGAAPKPSVGPLAPQGPGDHRPPPSAVQRLRREPARRLHGVIAPPVRRAHQPITCPPASSVRRVGLVVFRRVQSAPDSGAEQRFGTPLRPPLPSGTKSHPRIAPVAQPVCSLAAFS